MDRAAHHGQAIIAVINVLYSLMGSAVRWYNSKARKRRQTRNATKNFEADKRTNEELMPLLDCVEHFVAASQC